MTPKLADRLSKLIPRLASDADGEVLATVRAIRAALQSEGLDLHDFAASIADGEIVALPSAPQIAAAPTWAELSQMERRAWMKTILGDPAIGLLEREYLETLDNKLRAGMMFTPNKKRVRLFDERLSSSYARGMRP